MVLSGRRRGDRRMHHHIRRLGLGCTSCSSPSPTTYSRSGCRSRSGHPATHIASLAHAPTLGGWAERRREQVTTLHLLYGERSTTSISIWEHANYFLQRSCPVPPDMLRRHAKRVATWFFRRPSSIEARIGAGARRGGQHAFLHRRHHASCPAFPINKGTTRRRLVH